MLRYCFSVGVFVMVVSVLALCFVMVFRSVLCGSVMGCYWVNVFVVGVLRWVGLGWVVLDWVV